MSCDIQSAPAPERVYRIGRASPWSLPDWAFAKSNGTFGNRWDDPAGVYRVLYTCEQRIGCFIETLARFRVDEQLVGELANIEGDEDEEALAPGFVSTTWLSGRMIGDARVVGEYADIAHTRSLFYLRSTMAPRLVHYGVPVLDAGAIRQRAPRELTQEISRHVFDCQAPRFDGIRYLSRFGDELSNWALFEDLCLMDETAAPIRADDADLLLALERLELQMVDPVSG